MLNGLSEFEQQYLKLKATADDLRGKIHNFENYISQLREKNPEDPAIERLTTNMTRKQNDLIALNIQILIMEDENKALKKLYDDRLNFTTQVTVPQTHKYNSTPSEEIKHEFKVPEWLNTKEIENGEKQMNDLLLNSINNAIINALKNCMVANKNENHSDEWKVETEDTNDYYDKTKPTF